MVKNILKYSIILLIGLFLISTFIPSKVYANTTGGSTNTSTAGFDLGDLDNYQKDPSSPGKLKDKAEVVLGIIKTVGIVGSVVALIVMGIRYMLGSIEQKTQYKETMKPYLIGCLLVFSGSFLPELIYQIVKGINF